MTAGPRPLSCLPPVASWLSRTMVPQIQQRRRRWFCGLVQISTPFRWSQSQSRRVVASRCCSKQPCPKVRPSRCAPLRRAVALRSHRSMADGEASQGVAEAWHGQASSSMAGESERNCSPLYSRRRKGWKIAGVTLVGRWTRNRCAICWTMSSDRRLCWIKGRRLGHYP